jgi:hypothetical protein
MTARHYRIALDGVLGSRFSSSFAGFHLEQAPTGTVLVGTCPDSSALFGILDQVAGLGLGLVTVDSYPVETAPAPSPRDHHRTPQDGG